MSDRIKLAEAMGWEWKPYPEDTMGELTSPRGQVVYCTGAQRKYHIPDPFTDANDDYAVLEWIREQHFVSFAEYYLCMVSEERTDYQIGDYARAALKVMK